MSWRRQFADISFEGIFHRQIDMRSWDAHTAVGWLEDDFHHFGVTLIHDGKHIRDLRIAAPRGPFSTCPGAVHPLRALIGQRLVSRCADVGTMVDMRRNCTHLLDLASLVVAHAWSGRSRRRYHGTVQPLSNVVAGAAQGLLRATLQRDGREVLAWDMQDYTITAPAEFADRGILHGFREWTDTRSVEDAEDALVLRRVAYVAYGRRIRTDHIRVAADVGQGPVCHSFQPEWSSVAVLVPDTRRSFDQDPGAMLALVDSKP